VRRKRNESLGLKRKRKEEERGSGRKDMAAWRGRHGDDSKKGKGDEK